MFEKNQVGGIRLILVATILTLKITKCITQLISGQGFPHESILEEFFFYSGQFYNEVLHNGQCHRYQHYFLFFSGLLDITLLPEMG